MAESGAQPGNDNYRKGRIVSEQIRRQLVQNPDKLERMVRAQIEKACDGDLAAAMFIRDSVDGRPAQQVTVEGGEAPMVSLIRVMVVNPDTEPRIIEHSHSEQSLTLPAVEKKKGEEIIQETPPLPHPRQVIVGDGGTG